MRLLWRRAFTHVNDGAWILIITQRVPYYATVSCTYKSICVHSLKWVPRTHECKYAYLWKCLPRTYWSVYVVLIETSTSYSFYCYWRAPTGRYSCKAQGASPGLIIETYLLSPVGAALTARIWFVSLRFVVLRRHVFIRWGIYLRG